MQSHSRVLRRDTLCQAPFCHEWIATLTSRNHVVVVDAHRCMHLLKTIIGRSAHWGHIKVEKLFEQMAAVDEGYPLETLKLLYQPLLNALIEFLCKIAA